MTSLPATVTAGPSNLPPNTCALPRTGQLAGLLTAIRDKQTARGDFIFYSDRIIRLLVEEGASRTLTLHVESRVCRGGRWLLCEVSVLISLLLRREQA